VRILVDQKSLIYLDGTRLDYARVGMKEGFRFNNPNAKEKCGCGDSFNICGTMSQFANTTLLLSTNYFELFGLPRSFAIDLDRLDGDYRALQSRFHPDRFASASDADRRRSLEISTHINSAYLTLRRSLSRARYLLTLTLAPSRPNRSAVARPIPEPRRLSTRPCP